MNSCKILVPVRSVPDPVHPVRLDPETGALDLVGVRTCLNPFDEIALEESVRWRERNLVSEVLAVSVGPAAWSEGLRTALALGADRAILVETPQTLQPLEVARCLQKVVEQEQPGIVLAGKQSVDGDHAQTGPMLAGLLGWNQATCVAALERVTTEEIQVVREADGGRQRLLLPLPAVITVELRLNQPRYASLPAIMRARNKPLLHLPIDAWGIVPAPRIELLALAEPSPRPPGRRVTSTVALVQHLREAGLWR
ncbi:MAG: electron transfer flavoprotein subunit beta/FixA family protein [Magnetococcales bacterium]|nr:electron transfer flavoprotein subunit beta/FixA family protein [Magnetococcales bacterium]